MSTGLMSCVRENSPPLEMDGRESGAFSLPTNGTEPQKRRRFHPLRNLRRIFRRRTLTSVDTATSLSISSPSSPSSQLSSAAPTVIASVPAHNILSLPPLPSSTFSSSSYCKSSSPADVTVMSSTAYSQQHHLLGLPGGGRGVSSCGVAVIPSFSSSVSGSGGYYMKDINTISSNREHSEDAMKSKESSSFTNDLEENREMTDCQRSFSEGRLVDSDFSRDGLSQSHDSVFSESATASSLSIVLKAELFDALRKRRNRPDASDEDLGLPRSPTTPQRKDQSIVNQSEVSSLSLLSMASSDLEDELSLNYGLADKTSSSMSSSKMSSLYESSKTSDEIDFVISSGSRLSHSAARHKMAVRPKKKGPTRKRRTAESTHLPSTPEVNEEFLKIPFESKDITEKGKSHSLPPGVNAKILEQHSSDSYSKDLASHIKRSKTEKITLPTGAHSVRDISKCSSVDNEILDCSSSTTSVHGKKDEETGFFRRLLHRNSKKSKKSTDECDKMEDSLNANSNEMDNMKPGEKVEDYSHKVEETRKEIRKEILSEAKSSLSAMLNTFILSPDHETEPEPMQKVHKPKTGAAARQRVMPKDLSSSPLSDSKVEKNICAQFIDRESEVHSSVVTKIGIELADGSSRTISKACEDTQSSQNKKPDVIKTTEEMLGPRLVKSYTEETLKSAAIVRESATISEHFEKRERIQPKIVGLSPFMQKVSRTEAAPFVDSGGRPVPKQRKSVEKSKSFRYYSEGDSETESNLKKHENMPSLPDLTFSHKIHEETCLEKQENCLNKLPMTFEINDNNLIKLRRNEDPLPLSQGIYTKNIILTTSKPSPMGATATTPTNTSCNQNITEIEENIDKLVKSPIVTILKKSNTAGHALETKTLSKVCTSSTTTTMLRKSDTYEREEKMEISEKVRNSMTSEPKKINESVDCKEKVKSEENYEQKTEETSTISNSITTIAAVEMRNKDIPKVTNPSKTRRSSSVIEKFENNQVPEFMKITLNRVDSTRPKSNIVLSKNAKTDSDDKDVARRYSNENVEITDNKPPIPVEATLRRNSNQDESTTIVKSPIKKVDEENNVVLRNSENTQTSQALYDRRKSVTDEKLKYEKKLEELKIDKKKSAEESRTDLRRTSLDEETGVILRKKTFASINQSSNKEDTPELMKVFARRSLKIKDDELQSSFEEIEKSNTIKKFTNLDSDKENQSSSEEKLDKLPKVEITIQSKQVNHNGGLGQKVEEKNRSSLGEFRKPNNSVTSTPTKSYVTPIRYSNIVGYRTVSTIYGKTTTTHSTTSSIEQSSASNTNEQNNNNNNNTSTNNNKKVIGVRHTIGGSTNQTAIIDQTEESGEFKGILQRRAEWEKRAKEALK